MRHATIHVKQKRGMLGVTVNIVPPDAKFPDKISLKDLPEIEYPEEEVYMPEGVEPDQVSSPVTPVEGTPQEEVKPVEVIEKEKITESNEKSEIEEKETNTEPEKEKGES